jgi:hypothetical protein
MIENNPHISCLDISAQLETVEISRSSVLKILSKHKFHPYHMELHQELHGDDFQNRIAFCEWGIRNEEIFFERDVFTDESTFKNNETVNKHNMDYWAVDNPHWMHQEDHQNRWSLNVWRGVVNNRIVGPFFFEGHLNGDMHRNFLRDHLNNLLDAVVPLNQRYQLWLEHDGAPPPYSVLAREELQMQFGENWIGRRGPINWPVRSPDLTPLDFFFLWGRYN